MFYFNDDFMENEEPYFEEYGRAVELHESVKGYTYGHIVRRDGYKFVIQFSSGLETACYDDEFDYV